MGFLYIMNAGAYIDGFNMYGAIGDTRENHLKWVSYRRLLSRIDPSASFSRIVLFTAIPPHDAGRRARHDLFLDAMRAEGVEVVLGHFKKKTVKCRVGCGSPTNKFVAYEEKESDVNLAIHLVRDILIGAIDHAFVLSTDSDIAPAVEMAIAANPKLIVTAVNVESRHPCWEILDIGKRRGADVRKATVSRSMLRNCLLPDRLAFGDGTIVRPVEYDPPG